MTNSHYQLDCKSIVHDTERLLRARYHVSLQDAKGFQLHVALGQAVQMAIAEKWDEDEMLLRRLGINVSCEAHYETKRLYHK